MALSAVVEVAADVHTLLALIAHETVGTLWHHTATKDVEQIFLSSRPLLGAPTTAEDTAQ